MASSFGQTGTADSITVEYFTWEAASGRFLVHMHRDAADGLARDVIERSEGLPVEVGGLLLGHAGRGDRPVVWIERYQRIECQHRSGPHFILDRDEYSALEQAAADLSSASEDLNVVGFYRSHLRPGFQLEAPDFALTDRYFKDPEDLFLLIRPLEQAGNPADLMGQFFLHDRLGEGGAGEGGSGEAAGEIRAAAPAFPFRGRLVSLAEPRTPELPVIVPEPAAPLPAGAAEVPAESDPEEHTGRSKAGRIILGKLQRPERPARRIVPDFVPASVRTGDPLRPAREIFLEDRPVPAFATEDLNHEPGFFRRRWPLLAAILLVGAAGAFLLRQTAHRDIAAPPPAVAENATVLPLSLYVDPASAQSWRVTWRSTATALQGARSVQLFVRDGADQNRIDLTPQDVQSGSYLYKAGGADTIFRLEVTDSIGRVWAESFRLKSFAPPEAPRASEAPSPAGAPRPLAANSQLVVTRKVAPVVPSSIQPRMHGHYPVDVRVRVDARGRVASAVPVARPQSSLESFLTKRAVAAARRWRYQASRPGTEVIHFEF